MIRTVSTETGFLLANAGFPHLKCEKHDGAIGLPTTDELIDELPSFITYCGSPTLMLTITKIGHYRVDYERNDDEKWCEIHQVEDKSLPEALAQMWLWLKKENLIS